MAALRILSVRSASWRSPGLPPIRTPCLRASVASFKAMSVTQGFAFLQGVLDALQGLLGAEQGEEGLALQVQVVLLAHRARRALAAAEDGGHLGGDQRVVLADLAAALRVVDAGLEGGQRGPAQGRHLGPRPAGPMARSEER